LAARFGFLDEGKDISGIIAAIDEYLNYVAGVGVYSEYHSLIMKAKQLLPKKQGGIMAIHEFTSKEIQFRTAKIESGQVSQKGDFLGKMLDLHVKNPEKTRMEDVFMACATNIGAGSDTTSISLSSVIYHLCKYPRVVHGLRDEIAQMEALNHYQIPLRSRKHRRCRTYRLL
jgi:cytochrome P450